MNGRHRYCVLKERVTKPGSFGCKSDGLHVLQLSIYKGSLLNVLETVLSVRSCNKLSGLVHSNVPFLDAMKSILIYAKIFDYHKYVSLSDVRNSNITEDSHASNLLHGASSNTIHLNIKTTKFLIWLPAALWYVETGAWYLPQIMHL